MKMRLSYVSKSFQTKKVLEDISFDVKEGEFVSLIGPSGSGKSTLFSLIGGILTPDKGDILMGGKSIINQTGHVSYMPQQDALFPWRTVLKNVLLGQELHGEIDIERAMHMLRRAGLADVIHAYPNELSGGMRQRVSFIRALLSPRQILCLDEPFSALDEFTRMDMQKWLLATWEQHEPSILFITHSIEEALFLSDKIIVLTNPPARIRNIISVPFSRPRDESLRLTHEFFKWKKDITEMIQIQV